MSIVRLYRETVGDDGTRLFEYREAWADAEAGEFVVHHGRVGQPGTVGEQPLADQAEGDQLLAAFVAQGAEEGFAEADPATFAVLPVAYRLRGREATVIERRTVERLRVEVTHQLAWRGLGEVEDVVEEAGALVLRVRTPTPARPPPRSRRPPSAPTACSRTRWTSAPQSRRADPCATPVSAAPG